MVLRKTRFDMLNKHLFAEIGPNRMPLGFTAWSDKNRNFASCGVSGGYDSQPIVAFQNELDQTDGFAMDTVALFDGLVRNITHGIACNGFEKSGRFDENRPPKACRAFLWTKILRAQVYHARKEWINRNPSKTTFKWNGSSHGDLPGAIRNRIICSPISDASGVVSISEFRYTPAMKIQTVSIDPASLPQPKWQIHSPDRQIVHSLSKALCCHPITAAVLVNRGITTTEAAKAFLHPNFRQISFHPGLQDMEKAVERIYRAILRNEHILVFGDYDADGVTATVVLTEFLRQAGAIVSHYIPHRIQEGYGLKPFHVDSVIRPRNATLVVTVDCGSSSHEAILEAKPHGIDVIVTDHHRLSPPYPEAYAIINPDRESDCNGFADLAGVGVCFLLVMHLRKAFRSSGLWRNRPEPRLKPLCELVALGTIADMVPLTHFNRLMVKTGLESIAAGANPGIRSLALASGLKMNGCIRTEDIAFRLSPRLNAAGRMQHAEDAVNLLLSPDEATARPLAILLNRLNGQRQDVERSILADMILRIEAGSQAMGAGSIVSSDTEWHPGVLGIVAAKLVQRYHRPTVLIHVANGIGKGSGRSIPGVDLYGALNACSDLLMGFGGHPMAAGLTLAEKHIEAFCRRFDEIVLAMAARNKPSPVQCIDGEIFFHGIEDRLLDELEALEPFGIGNPEPIFLARNVEILNRRTMGECHLGMALRQKQGTDNRILPAVAFNISDPARIPKELDQILFRLRWNYWNGKKSLQLLVESFDLEHLPKQSL
jgi:single-stranded-DNA-specific exonuclease